MALAEFGWELTVTLMDAATKTTQKKYQLREVVEDDGGVFDMAALRASVTALLGDLNGVTDLAIAGYRLALVVIEDAITIPTLLSAQVSEVAELSVRLATSPLKSQAHSIPGPIAGIFTGAIGTSGWNVINPTHALLDAYMDNFEDSGGTAYISDGEFAAAGSPVIVGARVSKKTTRKQATS